MVGENITAFDGWVHSYPIYSKRGVIGRAHGVLGWAALAEEEYAAAEAPLKESVAVLRGLGDREYEAWALAGLGRAELGLGNRVRAQQHLLEALQIAVEIRAFVPLLHLMPILPLLLADAGDAEAAERAHAGPLGAVELHALATSQPFVANARLFEDIAGRQVAAIAATLPPDVVAAAQERGRALDWWETAEMLLRELCVPAAA